jgi:hypothetical protein
VVEDENNRFQLHLVASSNDSWFDVEIISIASDSILRYPNWTVNGGTNPTVAFRREMELLAIEIIFMLNQLSLLLAIECSWNRLFSSSTTTNRQKRDFLGSYCTKRRLDGWSNSSTLTG